jgi:hypothetical protein
MSTLIYEHRFQTTVSKKYVPYFLTTEYPYLAFRLEISGWESVSYIYICRDGFCCVGDPIHLDFERTLYGRR